MSSQVTVLLNLSLTPPKKFSDLLKSVSSRRLLLCTSRRQSFFWDLSQTQSPLNSMLFPPSKEQAPTTNSHSWIEKEGE